MFSFPTYVHGNKSAQMTDRVTAMFILDIFSVLCGKQSQQFCTVCHDVFVALIKWFLCLNLTKAKAQRCDKIEIGNATKQTIRCNIKKCSVTYVWFCGNVHSKHLFCRLGWTSSIEVPSPPLLKYDSYHDGAWSPDSYFSSDVHIIQNEVSPD